MASGSTNFMRLHMVTQEAARKAPHAHPKRKGRK